MERHEFMKALAMDLMKPWAQERLSFHGQQRSIQETIRSVSQLNIPREFPTQLATKKRCVLCVE